jgi:hypothetical protein
MRIRSVAPKSSINTGTANYVPMRNFENTPFEPEYVEEGRKITMTKREWAKDLYNLSILCLFGRISLFKKPR